MRKSAQQHARVDDSCRRPLSLRHQRRARQAAGQRRRHEPRRARRVQARPPPRHRRGAGAAADRPRRRLRRDVSPDRPPTRQALRRRAAHRRRVDRRRRDGRARARPREARLHGRRPAAVVLKQERQRRILELVDAEGRAVATELSERLGVSGYTVRRDLDELAGAGRITRVHGGALSATPATYEERQTHALAGKLATARAAAGMLRAGQTVILDGGSTALQLAAHVRGATVITHSPPVASALAGQNEVILIGGTLDPRAMVATGATTIAAYREISAGILFLGVWALDATHGLSGGYREESEVRRTMIESAKIVVGLADATKLGTVAPFRYAAATALTHLATDGEDTTEYEEMGIEILR